MENPFDEVAKTWDDNPVHINRTNAIAKCFLEMIPLNKEMRALEFGAGTGLLSFALKDHFAEIVLLDSSAAMVRTTIDKIVDQNIQNMRLLFFNLEKYDYEDDPFDVIFSQMAMHHVKDIDKMLGKFNEYLKPGGILVIADLYSEDGTFHDAGMEVHFGFDPGELGEKIKQHGFGNVNHKQCYEIERTKEDGSIKKYPVFFMFAEKISDDK